MTLGKELHRETGSIKISMMGNLHDMIPAAIQINSSKFYPASILFNIQMCFIKDIFLVEKYILPSAIYL